MSLPLADFKFSFDCLTERTYSNCSFASRVVAALLAAVESDLVDSA